MVEKIEQSTFMQHFSVIPDPRKPRNQLYTFSDLIFTGIIGIMCGYEDWEDVSLWTDANLSWLQSIGICKNGAPSHDTYSRFFRFLDPKIMEESFIKWTKSLVGKIEGFVAIDGKTLRGSKDQESDLDAIHMVSAFAAENEMILGQLKTSGKGKEIEGIKLILDLLDLEGTTVTIDAGGCHKEIVEKIREKKADYLLGLKKNQLTLWEEVANFFEQVFEIETEIVMEECKCDYFVTEERSRNRIEKRQVWATDSLDWLPQKDLWKDLQSLVCVKSNRTVNGKTTEETRFYISSRKADAEYLGKGIREHWGIENKVHHILDVAFDEDKCRIRKDHGAENISVIRRAVLNMAKHEKSKKLSLTKKRSYASLNPDYRLKLLGVVNEM